jgi:hypothetical protein
VIAQSGADNLERRDFFTAGQLRYPVSHRFTP